MFIPALTIFIFIFSSLISAQDNQADQQKAWMDYMTPGKYHEMMAKSVGEWKTVTKYWMDPSGEPMVSEGTAVNVMILGGRYLQSTQKTTMMNMPFEGIAIQGYDNAKKEFVSTWIDNMGTGIAYSTGMYDDATMTLKLKGKFVDPMTGGDLNFTENFIIVDDNHQKMEMFMIQGDKEVKWMEMELTR